MKYESSILKRLVDTYGVVGNPRYISEIIKEFIVRGKERFPELFTYQADWLAHIDEFGLNPTYTVSYTGQSIYAPNTLERPVISAILSGSTKYRDIDTGEFLETFEEGRNLELVSVKMPVLSTTGKNLFDGELANGSLGDNTGNIVGGNSPLHKHTKNFIKVVPNTNICIYYESEDYAGATKSYYYDKDKNYLNLKQVISTTNNTNKIITVPNDANICYMKIRFFSSDNIEVNPKNIMIVETSDTITTYEPYKSNILTVNEDVTLRGIGDVQDTLDLMTREKVERIGEIVLDGSEHWLIYNGHFYTTNSIANHSPKCMGSWLNGVSNMSQIGVMCDKGVIRINLNNINDDIQVLKNTLSQNPLILHYELKTPTIKTVDLTILDQNGQGVEQLKSFNGGTHVYTSSLEGSLVPSVDISVVTNLEETLKMCSLDGNTL